MIKLTEVIVKRPISAIAIIAAIIIFGVFSALSMEQEITPELNMSMMLIQTRYTGAGPEDVEKLVSRTIEGSLSSLSGVKKISSTSQDGISMVMLQYEYGVDMNTAYIDLMERINRISGSLPDDSGSPVIMQMDINASDTMKLSIESGSQTNLLSYVENEVVPELEKLSSVADVSVSGGREQYIRVELLEEKLKQYGITMNAVISSVSSADFSMSNGDVNYGDQSVPIRSVVEYGSTESLKNIPISLANGGSIRLADVANVYDANKASSSIGRFNGEESINIGIQKRQSATAVSVSKEVMKVVKELNAADNGVSIDVVNDSSEQIQSSVMSVVETLILAIAISMIVLYLFLGDIRASLIIGSSMPVSLLVTLTLIYLMGFTLNLVTLSAMTMGVGMMVDNSIVVMDSIFKSNSQGKTPMEAAVDGTKFVMGSIIGSTITTVVVFLPLAFISGMAGQMFTPLGFTITFSLVASLFSAITLVPLFFVQFKPREKHKAPAALFLKKLERGYGKLLKNILNKKKTVIVCVLAFMVLSVFLALQLNVEMLPATDEGIVNIEVEMRPGLRLEKADEIMLGLEEMIAGHPDLDHYITTVKAGGSNSTITAYLQDHRKTETTEVVEQWRNESKGVMNCNISINASSSTSSTSSNDNVEIKLKGNDLNTMKEFAGEVEAIMTAHPDIITVSTDLESGNPQAKIVVDPVKASALGLTPSQVSSSISMAINGSEAATLRRNGHDYSIQVEYPAGRYEDMTKLRGMVIVSSTGASVPLMDIVSIEFSNAPSTIKKENNQYIVTVNGTPKTVAKYSAPSEIKAQVKALQFPEGVELAESSSMESMMEEFTGIIIAIVIAILLVFLVMTIQFESFKHSLMVMLCIPFSLIGSFTFLFVARATISIISLLGFLILIGTVVNNGILFVDTTNEYRRSMDLQTALIHTGRHRLRPILLTTLTTVLSMIPLALAIGEGADMMQGLGIVVIGGLSASTLLTLLFLPTFYLIIDGNSEKKRRREKRRRMKEEKSEQMMA